MSTRAGYAERGEFALVDSTAAMTYIVTETCVDLKDKSCIEVCPVDCIHEAAEDRMVYIDPDECIDCGACVDPCPVDAIFAEEDVPEAQVLFVDINKVYFKDKALARSQVANIKPPVAP
jgi:ferredoxin